MAQLEIPVIYYQCVGKYTKDEIATRLDSLRGEATVLVGSSSSKEEIKCNLQKAYTLAREYPDVFLGAVTIPERHEKKQDEHLRLVSKQKNGAGIFISQFIFNIEKAKNMISDYYFYYPENNFDIIPFIFTLTPCASQKTMDLLQWLGVSIPG